MTEGHLTRFSTILATALMFAVCRTGKLDGQRPVTRTGPLSVTGQTAPDLAPFDRLLTSFVREHAIPGAALAVVRDGHLMLARGYGWADLQAGTPVQPRSLFRIASLSKPITAVAILQLVDRGKLTLASRPFQLLPPVSEPAGGRFVDARLARITILQLLQHTGGFDRDRSFDPMFRSVRIARAVGVRPPAGPDAIIRYMREQPLDFDPGTHYAYSNFGYCVLGRVIEQVAKCPYEKYVQDNVLRPLGIHDMQIGHTLRSGRADREVTYYTPDTDKRPSVVGAIGKPVEPPYGAWYLEAMDAHGGWLASVVDMARFACAWGRAPGARVLSDHAVETMFARPTGPAGFESNGKPKAVYYGCGWLVRPTADGRANQWHTGALPGTATLMVRRHDGLCWIVLFNTRHDPSGGSLTAKIDPLLHRAADAVKRWPKHDLFQEYK